MSFSADGPANSPCGVLSPSKGSSRRFRSRSNLDWRARHRPALELRVRVTGYSQFAEKGIKAANANGDNFLEVPWRGTDVVMHIMKRLEDKLCIPVMYWRLAADGIVFDPITPVAVHPFFEAKKIVGVAFVPDLVLVPTHVVEEYVTQHLPSGTQHQWKALPSSSTASFDLRERATALFNLIRPHESASWEAYIRQRTHADSILRATLDKYTGIPLHPLLVQIHDGVKSTLSSTSLRLDEQSAVADGVVPLYFNVVESDDTRPTTLFSEAEVLTRIYSPTTSAAVDVHLKYVDETPKDRTDYSFRVIYRIHAPVIRTAVAQHETYPAVGQNGWLLLFELELDAKSVPENKWGPRPADVKKLHESLLGPPHEEPNALVNAMDVGDTMFLLLAAVGMSASIPTSKEAVKNISLASETGLWKVCDSHWLGRSIRRACGSTTQDTQ
ncbi:uncharacterized protein FIBRA_00165 [Fibroporia radiculosa]|uniref:Uncharacterized protein n=1 Tax=Fibroporia radiculosa TaxID=599839 RepID=J7SBW4_9APHY|nr:uncharacterized protein FIBRA_00165 [Fibroporia radiculosa]CCL98171.1 predicted protein [Fibroporia radiculosa]